MPYRDDSLITIEIGSFETRSIFGLSESLCPPSRRTRTRVAKRAAVDTDEYLSGQPLDDALANGETFESIIYPVVAGEIKDWDALTIFLEHLLLALTNVEPGSKVSENPVSLLVPPQWSTSDREKITQIFMERFFRPAFMIIDMPLASVYACNSMTGVIIDVGYEKTDVSVVLDSILAVSSQITIPIGGKQLTEHFHSLLLANLPLDQSTQQPLEAREITMELAESIKCSSICELQVEISKGKGDGMAFQQDDKPMEESEEGVLDIAAVVASGKTREYLARAQAQKNGADGATQAVIPNVQLTHNTVDIGSRSLVVGSDRFRVCEPLLDDGQLLDAVYDSITGKAIDPARRPELWNNIVVVGGGSRVKGFREKFLQVLQLKFGSALAQASVDQYAPALFAPYPTAIRAIKIPVHFPEWNSKDSEDKTKGIMEEATFLGGCIVAHIAYSGTETGSARLYITRSDYNEIATTGRVI